MTRLAALREKIVTNTRNIRFRRPKVGARPGTLVFARDAPESQVRTICYSAEEIEYDPDNLEEILARGTRTVWVDVQGLGSKEQIRGIAELAEIPDLMLEDMVNVPQRSHADLDEDRMLLVTRMVRTLEDGSMYVEQVSLYLYKNIVVTFQEAEGDVFASIRTRLKNSRGPLRNHYADFLAYTLLDTIVDAYFPLLEHLADRMQLLEHYALTRPNSALLRYLVNTRNEVVRLHRAIKPQKELVASLLRDKYKLMRNEVRMHLDDTFDHVVQATEVGETLRDMSVNLLNLYMSSMANHTNDKMKVLTIMASIFIPLTFIAGVYGMNFDHMPELHVRWAYPAVWGVMGVTAVGLLGYFYHKGWITDNDREMELTLQEHLEEMKTKR